MIQINFVASAWMSRDFSARFVPYMSLLMARLTISRSYNNLFGCRRMSGRIDFAHKITAVDPERVRTGGEKDEARWNESGSPVKGGAARVTK